MVSNEDAGNQHVSGVSKDGGAEYTLANGDKAWSAHASAGSGSRDIGQAGLCISRNEYHGPRSDSSTTEKKRKNVGFGNSR